MRTCNIEGVTVEAGPQWTDSAGVTNVSYRFKPFVPLENGALSEYLGASLRDYGAQLVDHAFDMRAGSGEDEVSLLTLRYRGQLMSEHVSEVGGAVLGLACGCSFHISLNHEPLPASH